MPKREILDSSKVKEFAADNFRFDESGRKFFKRVEKNWEKEKLLITSNFSFSHSIFRRLGLQTPKNQGLFGKSEGSFTFMKFWMKTFEEILKGSLLFQPLSLYRHFQPLNLKPFPKLKEFEADNFRFDENGRKFFKWVENTMGKGEIAHYE